jgi:SAM-dependent methyltransferase
MRETRPAEQGLPLLDVPVPPRQTRRNSLREDLFGDHHELEERHWWFRARRRALQEISISLVSPGAQIVDIGCGTGADIASFPAEFVRYGLDASQSAIDFAMERHSGVDFRQASIPGAGRDVIAGADLVLLCDVLEHIEDDYGFLSWVVAAMRDDAHLLITVPADPRLWSPHDEVYGHFRRYTRESLTRLTSSVPATTKLLAPFNWKLYPVARVARAIASRRGRSWGKRSDLLVPWNPLNQTLERIFSSEVPGLLNALSRGSVSVGGTGVSLLTVLRKQEGS